MVACTNARWGSSVVAMVERGAVGSCVRQHGSGVGAVARQNGSGSQRRNGSKVGGHQLATNHCLDIALSAVCSHAYSNVVEVIFFNLFLGNFFHQKTHS